MSASFETKLAGPDQLEARVALLPRPLVFTNGVFDILHRGHVTYLDQARALGAALLVALNSDASARRLGKGADRPVNPLGDRAAVVAALESVSLVTWFDADTPLALIERVAPDVLVKGGDWPVDRIAGADLVRARGGNVISIPFEHRRSTTALLEQVRASVSTERTERTDRTDPTERTDPTDRTERSDRTDRTERSDPTDPSDRTDRTDR
ncbi:MAG: bifunctional heptose 7-phosphate kinase/heptose 1-phosphate adenyltransferase [Burkholderiales bacterium]|nr:MAG: bifunctional heptose 7-phosphate kinase/heptose 1-phosphate adenyltransferase [Burkholderiales bacterium]